MIYIDTGNGELSFAFPLLFEEKVQINICVLVVIVCGALIKAHEHWGIIDQYGIISSLNQRNSITVPFLCICFLQQEVFNLAFSKTSYRRDVSALVG